MTKKTRLRAARIAAAAVFAAGASLTAAGAAQAVGLGVEVGVGKDGLKVGAVAGPSGTEGGTAATGSTTEGTTGDTTQGTTGDTTEGTTGDTTQGTTGDTTEGTTGDTTAGGTGSTGGSTGGSGDDGGTEGQATGGSGGSTGDTGTCVLDQDNVKCEDGTGPDQAGPPQQVGQQTPREELAETGASETAFLLVGAATMIAGGVAFRLMPRLVSRRTAA